jgi:protein gp37
MGEKSKIAWTHATFNFVWGCQRVSRACLHCYAESLAKKYAKGMSLWGANSNRRFFGDTHWNEPLKWDRKAAESGKQFRVFCGSMCDVCEDYQGPDKDRFNVERERLKKLILSTPHLTWLLLTKRPENYGKFFWPYTSQWPTNVWAGTTVENQESETRIVDLIKVPSKIRFLSCEPLVSEINLWRALEKTTNSPISAMGEIHWVIGGGESGPHFQEMNMDHFRGLFNQTRITGAAWFAKQDSHRLAGQRGRIPDDLWKQEFPT